eukprot:TRINITY_DN32453_c0_g1_i2.p1 TRINITY_DN32453_c0_g1~~TRINITY_DN32453_c0_g1_i2.p1  ORF type:complete len:127 (+),score=18.34 TRINITY_DN32453_c0_g1_i2:531-911(+)
MLFEDFYESSQCDGEPVKSLESSACRPSDGHSVYWHTAILCRSPTTATTAASMTPVPGATSTAITSAPGATSTVVASTPGDDTTTSLGQATGAAFQQQTVAVAGAFTCRAGILLLMAFLRLFVQTA